MGEGEETMSDIMLFGVLRMPFEMAMANDISRKQFWDRAQQAASRIEQLDKRIEQLEVDVAIENASRKYWEDAYSKWVNTDKAARGLIAKDELIAALKAENESLKKDAELWRSYQKRKQDLIDRGFLRNPLRAEAEDTDGGSRAGHECPVCRQCDCVGCGDAAMAQGEKG